MIYIVVLKLCDMCVCDMVLQVKREDKTQGKILVVCVCLHKFDLREFRFRPSMESHFDDLGL
jgi:hypothetical protein